MLNINDIQKRLKRCPEPDEIKEIRENILNTFSDLEFIDDGHKYFLHNQDKTVTEMESVSSVCHRYEPKVDWDEVAQRKALKEGVDVDELKRSWKETNITSTSNGTLTHLFAEAYMWFFMGMPENMPSSIKDNQFENGYLIPYGEKQCAVARFYEDLYNVDNFYPVMPEAKIYIKANDNIYGIKYNIAGTFDALFSFKNKSGKYCLALFDWKTNKAIENDYNIKNDITLLSPFNSADFINQPKSIYTLQLSLYQLGLQQTGYTVADRRLVWLTNNGGNGEYHKIPVLNVTNMLINDLSK